MTVVVPAHDEAAHLGSCLASIRAAAGQLSLPVEVVVVLDGCTDATESVVPHDVVSVAVDLRNVGAARAAGFAVAARGPDRWLASTDADCEVPLTWLVDQLAAARLGADVVAGTVEVDDWSARHPALPPVYSSHYTPGAGDRHVHGANLGLSAATYERVGGFRPLRVHEDVDLVDRCLEVGASVCWSGATPVVTSARVSTRTPHGFSGHLTALELTLTEGVVA
ncbi:MAG: glycosyltransferase [Actinomycetota bacterium]|nr:glycosyltransferase [Actinomycetota bacterium]